MNNEETPLALGSSLFSQTNILHACMDHVWEEGLLHYSKKFYAEYTLESYEESLLLVYRWFPQEYIVNLVEYVFSLLGMKLSDDTFTSETYESLYTVLCTPDNTYSKRFNEYLLTYEKIDHFKITYIGPIVFFLVCVVYLLGEELKKHIETLTPDIQKKLTIYATIRRFNEVHDRLISEGLQ